MMQFFMRATESLRHRIALMVGRGRIVTVNDTKKMQLAQINLLAGETLNDVERVQQYGFTSHPLNGAEAVVVCVSGNRSHAVILSVDDRRFRVKNLAQGEVAIYTDEGDVIHFKRGKKIEITAGSEIFLKAPTVKCECNRLEVKAVNANVEATDIFMKGAAEIQGNVKITGNVKLSGDLDAAGRVDCAAAKIGDIEFGTHSHKYAYYPGVILNAGGPENG